MQNIVNSPQGRADRAEGRALYAEQENAQLRQQLVQQQAQQGPSLLL